jgi:hypothetical protein
MVQALNLLALGIISLPAWIGEFPGDWKPFGLLTHVAEFLGFLAERTPQRRLVASLRKRELSEPASTGSGSCTWSCR